MECKFEQTKLVLRKRNSIKAFKILDVREGCLIVRNPYKRENTVEIPVPKLADDYKVGDFADVVFYKIGSTSYRTELLGHTPPDFVPTDGEDIGV